MSLPSVTTAEQLFDLPDDGHRYELLAGRLVRRGRAAVSPTSPLHASVTALVTHHMVAWALATRAGQVLAGDGGFVVARNPDTVLAPDVAFVGQERLPPEFRPGFFPGPPDLAVEVVSPRDSWASVQDKAMSWLEHGVRAVWVVDAKSRTVTTWRSSREALVLKVDDRLDGGELLPGFSVPVLALFPAPRG